MKKLLLAGLLLFPLGGVLPIHAADNGVAVFAYTADQLAAKFDGQNRKAVVTAITTVPTYESTFTAADGTEYQVVRYGKLYGDYRVFLFRFKWPQPLVSVADNAKGILALNEKYGLALPLSQQDITGTMRNPVITTIADVANNTEYQAYQNGSEFYVFQNGFLVQTFDNAQDFSAFMAALTASNSAYAAQQAKQQTALEQAQLNQQAAQTYTTGRNYYYYGPSLGIVVAGSLLWNATHHRHHFTRPRPVAPPPQPHHSRLAPLKPGHTPAGTPMMRDVNGKFMRY